MDSSIWGGESTPVPVDLYLKNLAEEWTQVASWSLNIKCMNVGGLLRLCVCAVFLTGLVLGNWYPYGRRQDKGKCLCLVMETSWSRDLLGFQHTLDECLAS